MCIEDDDIKNEERQKRLREKIARFRLFDDDFMTKVFEKDNKLTEFLLSIILQRTDLEVIESNTQVVQKSLSGRSVKLDIKAKDKTGKLYNIEIQRDDERAGEKRARYHSAILDTNTLTPNEDFDKLPETYVIFITEHDIFKCGLPLYHINRKIEENGMTFYDMSHIIYVNGEYKGNDAIGDLMHDFLCADPDEMKYKLLAEKTSRFKKTDKGARHMCKIMEEFAAEERADERAEIAMNLLEIGKMTYAEIAAASKLSESKVRELAAKLQPVAR
ncbi:MAG: PD-(D/E)XK nuclease family transposase [Spirochaetaceae bacterium]|nr:PD-(D/E)XK nuclease family transposase [Spirochaetaceae bacterium]